MDAVKGRWSRLSWLAGITLLARGAILTPDYSHSSHTEQRQSHPKTQSTYSATPESFWERTTTDPIAAYTLALVVFTSVLAVVAIRQISFLKRADDTARMAANAAKEAADATRATVLKMDEIAQRQLRAYVGVKGAIPVLPGAGEWPQINLLITNFGQTPAYDVDFTIQWAIGACPHVEAQEFPQGIPAAFGPGEGSVLDPGEEKQLNAGRDVAMLDQRYPDTAPFTVEGAEAIRTGVGNIDGVQVTVALYVHGYVRYRDVFGNRHARQFCQYYYGPRGTTVSYCLRHNTDESVSEQDRG